ncbi:hypothetical protein ACRALDRAFT_2023131 [Sodiomyces alcalophilus JCM 7366]|uniref:uncharacterized protein n=1 Tax=Sodiomyces alcalophilus JCM 7366 TaxID=591952 RepID=UPI0039B43F0B
MLYDLTFLLAKIASDQGWIALFRDETRRLALSFRGPLTFWLATCKLLCNEQRNQVTGRLTARSIESSTPSSGIWAYVRTSSTRPLDEKGQTIAAWYAVAARGYTDELPALFRDTTTHIRRQQVLSAVDGIFQETQLGSEKRYWESRLNGYFECTNIQFVMELGKDLDRLTPTFISEKMYSYFVEKMYKVLGTSLCQRHDAAWLVEELTLPRLDCPFAEMSHLPGVGVRNGIDELICICIGNSLAFSFRALASRSTQQSLVDPVILSRRYWTMILHNYIQLENVDDWFIWRLCWWHAQDPFSSRPSQVAPHDTGRLLKQGIFQNGNAMETAQPKGSEEKKKCEMGSLCRPVVDENSRDFLV